MLMHLIQSAEGYSRCSPVLKDGDSLVFLGDAVILLCKLPEHSTANLSVYAIGSELDEFGIAPKTRVSAIDYSALVTLCRQHKHCLSW